MVRGALRRGVDGEGSGPGLSSRRLERKPTGVRTGSGPPLQGTDEGFANSDAGGHIEIGLDRVEVLFHGLVGRPTVAIAKRNDNLAMLIVVLFAPDQ